MYRVRAGEAQLEAVALPTRKQEPYRYTDLESLYRTEFAAGPADGAGGSEGSMGEAIAPYLLEESKGQQMVFVNGVLNAGLSDMTNLDGVKGLAAGNLGAMDGAHFDKVWLWSWLRCLASSVTLRTSRASSSPTAKLMMAESFSARTVSARLENDIFEGFVKRMERCAHVSGVYGSESQIQRECGLYACGVRVAMNVRLRFCYYCAINLRNAQ